MIILLLFLQKQNLAFAVYLFGSVLSSKRLFRGPSTNDMKKWDGPGHSWPTPHTKSITLVEVSFTEKAHREKSR